MEANTLKWSPVAVTFLVLSFLFFVAQSAEKANLEIYIVLVNKPQGIESSSLFGDLDSWYQSFLPVNTSSSREKRWVHTYRNVVTGFSARLTSEEVKEMGKKEGFVSARVQKVLPLHTTHTPNMLGLYQNYGLWKYSVYGEGVIVGLLDTGITPDHPSFNDEEMPPPPAKWTGKCEFNGTLCNKKLIGARNFSPKGEPPYDSIGHGTHTSSTAAGSPVKGANYFGQANGIAAGMAPLAHLAMYKVCTDDGCEESDILAGMDAAVEDGVDILSLSLGGTSLPFYEDVIAIGAFEATRKGILVSCSAGNSGPENTSLANEAPWILTVGASTVDRDFRATVLLGDKEQLQGQSLYQPQNFTSSLLPLVYAGANGNESSAWCAPGSLSNVDIKGKIVLCERGGDIARVDKGQEVKDNGGAAMILMNDEFYGNETEADVHVLPASHVNHLEGLTIKSYINSTSSPMATIQFRGTVYGILEAPQVATFSSRGPSYASPGILKPDVIGPGVQVLAAWPDSFDNSSDPLTYFSMISGTSMSCPHLSGIVALLKHSHPDWSPAAIKSAIITTTHLSNIGRTPITDQETVPATLFDIGAGHVNPPRANNPGLIYDIEPDDYIPYLCGLGYTSKQVGIIVQRSIKCSDSTSIPEAQLNYPSFSIKLGSSPQTYTRTVTNVGMAYSAYKNIVDAPKGVQVLVKPDVITFNGVNQKATYTVTFLKNGYASGSYSQGFIYWFNNEYSVRSPIAVLFE